MSSPQKRSKGWGYEVEKQAAKALSAIWPTVKRTGSVNYSKDAPDLIAAPQPLTDIAKRLGCQPHPTLPIVVTKEKGSGKPLLVTLRMDDFLMLAENAGDPGGVRAGVAVQCKGRQSIWVHKVMQGLCEALKKG